MEVLNIKNLYSNYKNARDVAWDILIKNGISSLPVSPAHIIKNAGIRLISYHHGSDLIHKFGLSTKSNDGFSIRYGQQWMIFYNQDIKPRTRIRFTLAHEIGHIVLRHDLKCKETSFGRIEYTEMNNGNMNGKRIRELEANIFASRLLAPAIVLHELHMCDPHQIAALCGLSQQAAEYRANRMRILNKRNKFDISPLEQKVHKQFQEFIDTH